MAQSLGTVTKQEDGSFEGTLSMMTLNTKIAIAPNNTKEHDRQPDFRIFAAKGGEIGGGWKRFGKASGKPYISLTFAHPAFGESRIFANLAPAAGVDNENVLGVLWNPQN